MSRLINEALEVDEQRNLGRIIDDIYKNVVCKIFIAAHERAKKNLYQNVFGAVEQATVKPFFKRIVHKLLNDNMYELAES